LYGYEIKLEIGTVHCAFYKIIVYEPEQSILFSVNVTPSLYNIKIVYDVSGVPPL
jgi:hypothetical protein